MLNNQTIGRLVKLSIAILSRIYEKDSNKIIVKTNDLGLADDVNKDFETFKSIVANAVLDYMESQSDSDLIECLEKRTFS